MSVRVLNSRWLLFLCLGYSDASKKLFHTYPGPLVKGVTHKKSVIEFCEDQLRQGPPYSGALALIKSRGNSINSLHSSSLAAGANRGSFTLLWNYIILLLRQNGVSVRCFEECSRAQGHLNEVTDQHKSPPRSFVDLRRNGYIGVADDEQGGVSVRIVGSRC